MALIRSAKTLSRIATRSIRSITRRLPQPPTFSPPRIGVVVPTSVERQELLDQSLENLNPTTAHVVVVATSPGVVVPQQVNLIEDLGGINIQRWWNKGLDHLAKLGCDLAVVINDDVCVSQHELDNLAMSLSQSRATISSPGPSLRWFRRGFPLTWRMDGAIWAINLRHGLRPDERYQWWMGDRDLEVRARTEFGGLLTVPVAYEHVPGGQTASRMDLQELANQDMSVFGLRHAAVTRVMKYLQMTLRREQNA